MGDAVQQRVQVAGLILLVGTVAAGPFFQGLFYPYQQHIAEVAVGLGAVLWLLGRRGATGPLVDWRDPPTLATLALVAWYLVVSPWAVYPQGHLVMVLNLLATLLLFLVLRAEGRTNPGLVRPLALTLAGAGVAEALVSLLPYVSLVKLDPQMQQALAVAGVGGRLSGSFQYPNTAAIYLLAILFLIAGLAVAGKLSVPRLTLAAAAAFAPTLAFTLAASRGALLVLPLAVALLLLGLPPGRRLAALLLLLGPLAAAVAASRGFAGNAALHDTVRVLKWYAAGQVAAAMGGAALAVWLAWPARWRWGVAGAALLLVLAGGALGVARYGGPARSAQRILPNYAQRLLDLSWRTKNALLRLYFDRDALRMILDRPLVGAGGDGWERLYPQYQDFYYTANETHDGYLQTAVEAGLPALLALLAFAGSVAVSGWRYRRTQADGAPLAWSMAAGALAVLGHSAVEFNLSYLSMWLLVWGLTAPAATTAPEAPDERPGRTRPAVRAALLGAAGLLAVVAGTQAYAALELQRGDALAGVNRWQLGLTAYRQAARWAPLAAEPRERMARATRGKPEELDWLAQAIRRDPRNYALYIQLADAYDRRQNRPAQGQAALQGLSLQPAYYLNYELAMQPLMEAALNDLQSGRQDVGRQRVAEVRRLGDDLVARRLRTDPVKQLWGNAQPKLTTMFQLNYGEALVLSGQFKAALPYLQAAGAEKALQIQADTWLALALQRLGRPLPQALAGKPWVQALPRNPLHTLVPDGPAG